MLDHDTVTTSSETPPVADDAGATDEVLADLIRQGLTDLARHSDRYARVFADRAGVRLAYHVRAGQIDQLSVEGRAAMRSVFVAMQTALEVESGLDTNAFLRRVNGSGSNASY